MYTPTHQRGVTLIEVLVGMFLGLLVIGVALGSLLVSRGFTAATTDTSYLQQQAALAFRIIGQQIRQAGSLQLDLDVAERNKTAGRTIGAATPVGFVVGYGGYNQILRGKDNPGSGEYLLEVGYENYAEPSSSVNSSGAGHTLFRDCLGQGGNVRGGAATTNVLTSSFKFDATNGALQCAGLDKNSPQDIIRNVADFRVSYFVQRDPISNPQIEAGRTAASLLPADWANVVALEVCLDMVGSVNTDIPTTMTYTGCDGQQKAYGGRTHMVYRNVYNIRSQGVFKVS